MVVLNVRLRTVLCNIFVKLTGRFVCLEDSKAVANPKDGVIKTSTIVRDNRRYYFDLKENQKGRFLRVRPNCLLVILVV